MNRIPAIILKAVVVTAAALAPSYLYGQADMELEETEDYYQIQFNEGEGTPLRDLIILCQRITGFPIQFQEAEVQDQLIYIIGKQRVRKSSQGFFEYFQSVLVSYEFICAPYGPEEEPFFITIKKMSPAAAQRGGDIFKAQAPVVALEELVRYKNSPGQLITTTLQMKYIEARTTLQSLNPYFMNTQLESLRSVDNSNSLIITGFANKVYYVTELIKLMDVPPQEIEVEFIKRELKYAVAEELEPILTQLVAAAQNLRPGQPAQPRGAAQSGLLVEPEPKIIAEPRTNSLLVTGSLKTTTKILSWVEQLDVETDPRGDIHVYRLKNTLAVDMQRVLDDMLQGQQQGAATRRQPGTGGSTIPSTGIEAPAQVVADEISNSLIITASKTKYAELLAVVQELDIRRKQVLIESAIVEMKSRVDDTLAIEMAGIDLKDSPDNYYRPFGFTSFGLSDLTWDAEDPSNSQRVPNVSTGFTGGIFDGDGLSLPFILYTLARENKANILSMPSILTNDNEQAVIQALDEEPTFSLNQGQNSDSTTFDGYEKAGITLTISPSISAGNYLKLQIKIEVSNFDESSDSSPPPKSTREVETAVTIPDGHTMVVGGVIINDQTEVEQKVPLLGDLPLIGWLFRSSAQTTVKVNLYIFITPHIIGDDFANLDEISYQKKKQVEALRGDVLLIDPDFEMTNADERMIGAGASWIFEIPSYAEPETGETSKEYIKPKEKTDNSEK